MCLKKSPHLKICPDFLKYANKYITKSKINISGTNGKTTTSGLISHLINSEKASVVNNALGANMLTGIVNALSIQLNPFKKVDYSVIECDEAFEKAQDMDTGWRGEDKE